ncbi:DUF3037 domain-containing protein [Pedobacter mendelii]|uniref:DUF3037 domain-containing protein n=1 Tax=Pedobacter mendelii TaxID=1908240 RepID=A0ABQ2BJX9_9SPHI|nr:DUF3037 domain-containing protein [Pedobacter mendelii]GGI26280.1 hypothetical protein GCM10008119_21870 [Pedobacter mendelii]
MRETFLFEYAVIRVMPRVEREEFINVGIVLYCAKQNFLKCVFELNKNRINTFSSDLDIEVVKENLVAFEKISSGSKGSGTIGQYDMASRFRWLTATRSTVIQCSKVHPGFCLNAEQTLLKLFQQLVL